MKIAISQMNSGANWRKNLLHMIHQTEKAADNDAKAVLFPENALYMGAHKYLHDAAVEMQRAVLEALRDVSSMNRTAVLIGSYPEVQKRSKKVFNTSVWIDEQGKILAKYRKIHLFDVHTPQGNRWSESKFVHPGKKLVCFRWHKITIGMSVCFDVRFPEHYRDLSRKGAEWLLVPSAFTLETGKLHWHTLLRARAIENLAAVLAPAQTGIHPDGRKTFGHSLVIEPWGNQLLDAGTRPGLAYVNFGKSASKKLRQRFSVL